MKRWLLDTNTCIALLGSREARLRVALQLDRTEKNRVGISSVVAGELCFGAAKSRQHASNNDSLHVFFGEFRVVPFDERASWKYGVVRNALERAGTPIGPLDTLIAAHALALGATLVTNNTSEFRRVKGLKVEDWLAITD